jgi:hypothetical protein
MSEHNFVYGVFENCEAAAAVIQRLHASDFKSAAINLVGPDTEQFQYVSAKIKDPNKRNFFVFGIIGALGGLWAGTMLAPTAPYVLQFQILTTLMAAISGSIVMAYFSLFLSAFLSANDPQFYANVYQADMSVGAALVSVEADSDKELAIAQKIIEEFAPVELIVRRAVVGPIIGVESAPVTLPGAREKVLSAAA